MKPEVNDGLCGVLSPADRGWFSRLLIVVEFYAFDHHHLASPGPFPKGAVVNCSAFDSTAAFGYYWPI
jgi:hypothetical protein